MRRRGRSSSLRWLTYSEAQSGLGRHFAAAVEEATVRALAFPQAGSPAAANTRRVFIKGFPFSIIYRAEGDGMVVFAVAHHARQPGYWRKRVKPR